MFSEELQEDFHHCLKCSMCQSACPTFKVKKLEHYAPRGRVQIIKHFLEGDLSISREFQEAVTSCILCHSCSKLCPSGVRIDRLIRNMRFEIVDKAGTRIDKRIVFAALSNPARLSRWAGMARVGQSVLVDALKVSWKLGNMPLSALPRLNRGSFRKRIGEKISPTRKRTGRVLYFTGCATDLMYEDVGEAVVEVLTHLGIEVLVPPEQVCCAAPIFLSGAHRVAIPSILHNLDLLDRQDIDAIVVDCATCGGAFKKTIPELMEDLGRDADKARRVAAKVKDVSEIVAERLEDLCIEDSGPHEVRTVTYHDPCHLVRSMGVSAEPRKILNCLPGITLREMEGAAECCGGGGSYQFEHVDVSQGITSAKRENIRATGAAVVATGCPGCRLTLHGNLQGEADPKVVHTIALLARLSQKAMKPLAHTVFPVSFPDGH